MNLQLDLTSGSDRVTGSVSGGTWTAQLEGDRAVFDGKAHIAPAAGTYTLVIPADDTCSGRPGGDGCGTVTVDKAGKLRFAGSLADGTKISQSASVSKNGEWPLFASLDKGKGVLLSWVTFASSATEDFSGEGIWIKPSSPTAKYYPNGFAMNVTVSGSRYVPPASGSNLLGLTGVQETLRCGNLPEPAVLDLTLDTSGKVTNLSSTQASLSFNSKTGGFTGKTTVPAQAKPISFSGVVLQKQSVARGYFLGGTQSGAIWIGPAQ